MSAISAGYGDKLKRDRQIVIITQAFQNSTSKQIIFFLQIKKKNSCVEDM